MAMYMLSIVYDPATPSDGSPSRQPQHAALEARMREAGHYLGGAGLVPESYFSRRVRRSSEGLVVSDGPFTETKEVLGGYFVVDCEEEQAMAYAAEIDVDNRAWIDVRQVFRWHPA